MSARRTVLVVGAGAFGLPAAIELAARGWGVTVVDPGPVPCPRASSTDTSKAVRMDYGDDTAYVALAERALDGWRAWNAQWGVPLYHEVGILLLAGAPMEREGFEAASYRTLRARGVPLERLDRALLGARFPAWEAADYPDGYFNPQAGWVESGRAVARLAADAAAAGVELRDRTRVAALLGDGARVTGVRLDDGETLRADVVLIAAGAWTPTLLPELGDRVAAVGQPVVWFEPREREPWIGERFPVWCADIARTGWYGFPLTADGALKVGHHGPGRRWQPGEPLEVVPAEVDAARDFAGRTFPALADAPLRDTRLCLYCDTRDGDFWIDHHPEREGLVVATGGSGHGFKFAPVLGGLIADVIERRPNAAAARFAWRRPRAATEQARQV